MNTFIRNILEQLNLYTIPTWAIEDRTIVNKFCIKKLKTELLI